MSSIELTIKENRPVPKIIKKDIDMLIDRLLRGFSANKHTVTLLNRCYLITKVHLAKWMKTIQASVNKWIKDGLIKPSKKSFTNLEFFDIDEGIDGGISGNKLDTLEVVFYREKDKTVIRNIRNEVEDF